MWRNLINFHLFLYKTTDTFITQSVYEITDLLRFIKTMHSRKVELLCMRLEKLER